MGLAIHNLIESVCNPSGRFKMLDGIRVKTDSKGDPVFLYKDRSVCFWVDWNGNGYVLKCFLHCQESDKASLQQIAEYLEGINSPFLVDYVYLNDEMLVFDDSGNSYYIDVVLMGYSSEMVPMDEFLDRAAKAWAYMEGRDYVTGADVQYVFRDVCAHRVLLKQDAVGADVDSVLGELLKKVENPDRHGLLSGMFKR